MSDVDLSKLATEEGIEIALGVRVRLRSLADYRQNEENPVSHTPRNAQAVLESIHKIGAARSGFASDDVIYGGNLTWEMMAEAGIEGVVEVTTDGNRWVMVNRPDLTPEQRKQAAHGDQWSAMLAEINVDQLLADMGEGINLDGIYSEFDLKDILGEALAEVETGEAPGPQIDKGAELAEHYGVQMGQVWQLGKHRLACIDSTDTDAVASLMQGKKAKLFATDPPYGANAGNIGYTAQRDDIEAITKDDLEGIEMQAFLESTFSAWLPYLENNCAWYLWHPMLTQGYFAAAAAADLIISRQIIWKKEQFIFGRGDYHWRHELCFYGWRKGHHPPFYGERNQDTVWEIPYDVKRSEVGHPTAKPVELFAIPMRNHLHSGEICAEPFCGSGSQLLAAEHHGVQCYAADIEPKWVALAIQRWVDLTGLEPKLLQ